MQIILEYELFVQTHSGNKQSGKKATGGPAEDGEGASGAVGASTGGGSRDRDRKRLTQQVRRALQCGFCRTRLLNPSPWETCTFHFPPALPSGVTGRADGWLYTAGRYTGMITIEVHGGRWGGGGA